MSSAMPIQCHHPNIRLTMLQCSSINVVLIIILVLTSCQRGQAVESDVNLTLVLHNCPPTDDVLIPTTGQLNALTSTAQWTVDRVNSLQLLAPWNVTVKLNVLNAVCTEIDYFQVIFEQFLHVRHTKARHFLAGILTQQHLTQEVLQFAQVLHLERHLATLDPYEDLLMRATFTALSTLSVDKEFFNVFLLVPQDFNLRDSVRLMQEFSGICIDDYLIYKSVVPVIDWSQKLLVTDITHLVVFGTSAQLESLIKCDIPDDIITVLVPTDGTLPTKVRANSFIIHAPTGINTSSSSYHYMTPTLFQTANSIIVYVELIRNYIHLFCNQTVYKINCLRHGFHRKLPSSYLKKSPKHLAETLRIVDHLDQFHYNVYQMQKENGSDMVTYRKVLQYNILYDNVTFDGFNESTDDENASSMNRSVQHANKCSHKRFPSTLLQIPTASTVKLRNEPWIFGFLSISLLGVILCFAIMVHLLVHWYRRGNLEGSPLGSILLLTSIIWIFSSVLPQCLTASPPTDTTVNEYLCLARTFTMTLSVAAAFSLILSRCILLTTTSRQMGFMSHVSGVVQAFLTLFMFAVQLALNVQHLGGQCVALRDANQYFIMSQLLYNGVLLLLLLCCVPLTARNRRNYCEGKYFAIVTVAISVLWSAWLPILFVVSTEVGVVGNTYETWLDPLVCLGLNGTAALLLGVIFVPRTYLMTIAATRSELGGTMPSLATAASTVDMFSGTDESDPHQNPSNQQQPIYDCINVAAINNAIGSNTCPTTYQRNIDDIYTCPTLPVFRPSGNDKTTRF